MRISMDPECRFMAVIGVVRAQPSSRQALAASDHGSGVVSPGSAMMTASGSMPCCRARLVNASSR